MTVMNRPVWLVAFAVLSTSTPALADMPNDPCMGLDAGTACVTIGGESGACVEVSGRSFLTCEEGASPSTTSGGTTDEGNDVVEPDDDGCSMAGREKGDTFAWIGLALFAALRRRR